MDEQMIESGLYTVRDPSRADAFSLGVTLLEAITLENCTYLYIRNPLRISWDKLALYTQLMRDHYEVLLLLIPCIYFFLCYFV